jgi:hypothetical protein
VTAANRTAFVQSVVSFIKQYNLDGVDFSWEYPGASDIQGVPPGSPTDGPNYLSFLQLLRSSLPSNVSISIAAPASYWYLRRFPIANMSSVVDYIVYMTYDLHGQWDYNSPFANPGCPHGNCLRSHVNLTETMYALGMITKAGVPANKVVVGIASYGRSFGMQNPSCTGPLCLFTGPNSTATPGECTATQGYISQAELEQISGGPPSPSSFLSSNGPLLSARAGSSTSVTQWHDAESDSDMMTYGNNSWVAYMSEKTKARRLSKYSRLNFGGSVEWAVDLAEFQLSPQQIIAGTNVTVAEDAFIAALATSNYDLSQGTNQDVSVLATVLVGWDGCSKAQQKAIYSGWQQSWKLMNYAAGLSINYNEAASHEYLGPSALNGDQRSHYQSIFSNIKTIQPSWWIPGSMSWQLVVRCDDPLNRCVKDGQMAATAYTNQRDAKYGLSRINFCPNYFNQDTLDNAIATWGDKTKQPVETWADVRNYVCQGTTWYRELLHLDWVSLAKGFGNNQHVGDVIMRFKNVKDGSYYQRPAHGAQWIKMLARYGNASVGSWIQRNADSLTHFALVKYVQNQLGNIYPHLPLAMTAGPEEVGIHLVRDSHVFAMCANGAVSVESLSDTAIQAAGLPLLTDDKDDEDDKDDSTDPVTLVAHFASKSLFPDGY